MKVIDPAGTNGELTAGWNRFLGNARTPSSELETANRANGQWWP